MEWEALSRRLRTGNWITLGILGCASLLFMDAAFTRGVILGGLLIIANFNVLQHTIRRSFSPDGRMKSNKLAIVAKYYFRLAVLGIIILIAIASGRVSPVGLTVGLSIVVISIVQTGIRSAWKTSSGEA